MATCALPPNFLSLIYFFHLSIDGNGKFNNWSRCSNTKNDFYQYVVFSCSVQELQISVSKK
jgi:hypothetical protein